MGFNAERQDSPLRSAALQCSAGYSRVFERVTACYTLSHVVVVNHSVQGRHIGHVVSR